MTIYEKLLEYFQKEEDVISVFLQGSRVYAKEYIDEYSDYDFLVIVNDIHKFNNLDKLFNSFGEVIIMQKPTDSYDDRYDYHGAKPFTYLVQYSNLERIDVNFVDKCNYLEFIDLNEPMIKLIDKNNDKALNVSDENQMFKLYKPSLKEFQDTINEFYWISLYVVKAINRGEDLQAITFYQNYFLKMLTKMIGFKIGHDNNYQVSLGKNYRFIKEYIGIKEYNELINLYYIKNMADISNKLFIGFTFFENYVKKVSQDLGYKPEDFSKIKDFIKAKY